MAFRLRAFAVHLIGSAGALALVLGSLYLGWYRWPGWYLTDARPVVAVMVGVDLVVGPLLTFVIASATKPRPELARDIGIIVLVQVIALGYGASTLWKGRPLYYTFSEDRLEIVQASDLQGPEIALGRKLNPALAPHWNSRPRWVWAPLPSDPHARDQIMQSAIGGGDDVIDMPRLYRPWQQGLATLCTRLKGVESIGDFSGRQKQTLAKRLAAEGLDPHAKTTLLMSGRLHPLLAVFDCPAGRLQLLLKAD